MTKSIGNWKGKPIEKHTKKELINIILQMANALRKSHKDLRHILEVLGDM